MKRPPTPLFSSGETDLRLCLRDRRSFWLYGISGYGKSPLLRRLVGALDTQHAVEFVSLYRHTSTEEWVTKLFGALPSDPPEGLDPGDIEKTWRQWCDRYAKSADRVFVVIDGWQWMPTELLGRGAQLVLRDGLSCGFVARAAPRTYLRTAQVLRLEVIECPLVAPRLGEPAVRTALCNDVLEDLSEECRRALAPLAHLPCPLDSDAVWEHFDRDALMPALHAGLLDEQIDTVAVARPLRDVLGQILEPSADQQWKLVECVWQVFHDAQDSLERRPASPHLVQGTLDVFASASRTVDELSEAKRALLKEVMVGLDMQFRTLLAPLRLGAALAALEQIPSRLLQSMPAARLRLGQCLWLVGRRHEADRLLDGLVRMKHTDAGKRAFLWTQMFAALGTRADEAIDALRVFVDERIEPGEPLEAVARLVLARALTSRGMFRQALPVLAQGIRAAHVNNAMRELHLMRAMHGMCLALTGERDSGIAQMGDASETLRESGFELAHAEAHHMLASVYIELGEYATARVELRALHREYERLADTRNLQMLQVTESIIAMLLDDDSARRVALDETLAPADWSNYRAELSFAQALHAIRRGDTPRALDKLHASVREHLRSANLRALSRLLRHYLPLLLENGEFARTRVLLATLDAKHLDQQDLGEVAHRLGDAIWLTGDLGEWELLSNALEVGGEPTLFPHSYGHDASPTLTQWVNNWERVVRGDTDAPQVSSRTGLAPLHRAWQRLWDGDVVESRRELLLCEELDLEGSLFGFLRALLHYSVRPDPRADMRRWRSEILEFWRRLSPMLVIHQLGFWEALRARRSADMPSALSDTFRVWLATVQKWRVEGAMLVDEALGEVFMDGRRIVMGANTVAFSVLCQLARHAPGNKPLPIDELFEAVWDRPYNPASSNSNVYVAIGNLRQELELDDGRDSVIRLERSVGYSIDLPVVLAR